MYSSLSFFLTTERNGRNLFFNSVICLFDLQRKDQLNPLLVQPSEVIDDAAVADAGRAEQDEDDLEDEENVQLHFPTKFQKLQCEEPSRVTQLTSRNRLVEKIS